jgi:MFS family permease
MTSFVGAAALLAAFVMIERRVSAPITPLTLFADRGRTGAYVARMLLIAGITGMFFFLTLFMQDVLEFSALATGFGFLPVTAAIFLASQASARTLVERFGERAVILAGISTSMVGLLWLSQLTEQSGYLTVLGPLLLVGVGNGSAFVPLTSAALQGVAPHHAGAASGLVNVMQQVGAALGLAVLVTIFGSASRDAADRVPAGETSETAADFVFVTGAHSAFVAAAALLATTLVVAAMTLPRRPAAPAPLP